MRKFGAGSPGYAYWATYLPGVRLYPYNLVGAVHDVRDLSLGDRKWSLLVRGDY